MKKLWILLGAALLCACQPDAYGIDILCGEGEQADSTSAASPTYLP